MYESPYSPSYGVIAPSLLFNKNGFGIKYPTKVDMPLNKETRNQTIIILSLVILHLNKTPFGEGSLLQVPLMSFYKDSFGIK